MTPAERVERLRLAFRANPRDCKVAIELGVALGDAGQAVPAARAFIHALSLDPNALAAHVGLALLRISGGDYAGALEALAHAADLDPSSRVTLEGFAACFERMGFVSLGGWYRKATNSSDVLSMNLLRERGQAYLIAGTLSLAEADLVSHNLNCPQDVDGLLLLAQLRARQGALEEGAALCRTALDLRPEAVEIWATLGDILARLGELDEAEDTLRRAIAMKPDFADPIQNLANVLVERGGYDEALALLRALVTQRPDQPAPHSNLSNLLLLLGEFKEGWTEYEWRRLMPGAPPRVTLPDWDGQPLRGRRLHLIGEQGIGDALMFASCIPDLEDIDGPVTLHVEPRLTGLLARSFPWLTVSPQLPTPTDTGVALPIGSLPRLLRPAEADFVRHRPFLAPDPAAVERWRKRFRLLGAELVVGISWRGGKDPVNRRQRTTRLEDWLPVLQLPGVVTVDLQYGDHADELRDLAAHSNATPQRYPELDPIADFDGFVAQVAALDLVVSVCNTTIHVAGGLGVPTLLIAPSAPSWRWLTERTECLWYPSVSLIRQARHEPWPGVLGRAADAVARRLNQSTQSTDGQFLPGINGTETAENADMTVNPLAGVGGKRLR